MMLSDVSIKRPVFATVISLVLVIFGLIAFGRLAVREYPDIDPPIVSVSTTYRGASPEVIETQVTQVIENAVAGIEGIKTINSVSEEARSRVTIQFNLSREIEGASADVRDKIGQVLRRLPEEADSPIVTKADSDNSPILWFALTSDRHNALELTDYANRVLVDRLATVPGVSEVRIFGERRYAMRIWLDKNALAARGLTVTDVEAALRRENVELPSGRVESSERELTVRTESGLTTPEQFRALVVSGRSGNAHQVRLGEVAKVERAAANLRSSVRANGRSAIGISILRQSKSNTLEVAEGAKQEMGRLTATLPPGMAVDVNYDESTFISQSIYEVYHALMIALLLVVGVVFVFLRNLRATLIPSIAIPVSVIASFMVLAAMGFSINVLTLLALVLAIGLVVDDAIVVLENIHRRMELGEPPLLAAVRGARQIGFAVIATTMVLVAVFVPIAFLEGNIGRLFTEFAISVAVAVVFSGLIALTLTPMLCSKMLSSPHEDEKKFLYRVTEPVFLGMNRVYARILGWSLGNPLTIVLVAVMVSGVAFALFQLIKKEYGPTEDRGTFTVQITGPEGASVEYMEKRIAEVERELMKMVEGGVAERLLTVSGSGGSLGSANEGRISVRLKLWADRDKTTQQIMSEIAPKLRDNPWLRSVAVNPPGLGRRSTNSPFQMVISGNTYEELAELRDVMLERAAENPNLINLTSDYDETKPQLRVEIDRNRAADLGVSVRDIGETLQTLLGSKVVTTYTDRGEQYDVILQARSEDRVSPQDLQNVFIRSNRTNSLVPLVNLVSVTDIAGPGALNRVDRMRSITLRASLAPGYTMGEAISYMENIASQVLPPHARIGYKSEAREFKETSGSLYWTFAMALVIVFLVLAAQFESFVNPFIILLSVPLAVTGALGGMYFTGVTLNVYSQIGIITLIGLVAKNGILIVEFANQLRAAGRDLHDAVTEASIARLRPILMTSIATVFGAMPLALASGAGAEARQAVGIVVAGGVTFSTVLTLVVVPVFYILLAKRTKPVTHVADAIIALERNEARTQASPAE
ncbi:MAG: efflux RND transporter permease subunit [Alphaproteobacteria bacterium]